MSYPVETAGKVATRIRTRVSRTSTNPSLHLLSRSSQDQPRCRFAFTHPFFEPPSTFSLLQGGCWEPNTPEPPPTVQADHFLLSTTPQCECASALGR